MTITIKSNPDGVTGAIQVNGVDKVTIGTSGITAGSFAPNSIDAAAAALAFSGANQSLAANGYQKLPSGLIIQWGKGTGSSASDFSVTFPIAFPNSCLGVVTSCDYGAGSGTIGYVAAANPTTTGFTGRSSTALSTRWIAVGY